MTLRPHASPIVAYTFQNDFEALSRVFSLPDLDYTDISQREQLATAIARWPLLAELARRDAGAQG
ncbi:YhjR family protein [Cronobacter sakazakii]|nr:YhjR family protein [Cronobacter sakazakii]ELY4666295.1 YhjR family protein [Cronobacter sakazakii]